MKRNRKCRSFTCMNSIILLLLTFVVLGCQKNSHSVEPIVQNSPKPSLSQITILPLGDVGSQTITDISTGIRSFYGIKPTIEKPTQLTKDLLAKSQTRYDALKILRKFGSERNLLIITEVDIAIKNVKRKSDEWGIFGMGILPGHTCVVSTFRLKKRADSKLFRERLQKVCIHEIGHNLGLKHCIQDPKCLMNDANGTISQVDREEMYFCEGCLRVLLEKTPIDSIKQVVRDYKDVKNVEPTLLVSGVEGYNGGICFFFPIGLSNKLYHKRPVFIPDNFLCVPAAYTDLNNFIDGIFIEDGKVISSTMNEKLTGACIISNDSIQIIEKSMINEDLINQVKRSGKSFFQQTLLVKNSKIVSCDLFRKKGNMRRSLIQLEGSYCVGESSKPVTIKEFQELLLSIGTINAINLDMGSWSEGWYKNNESKRIQIGDNMANTNRQTNWLVFTRNSDN